MLAALSLLDLNTTLAPYNSTAIQYNYTNDSFSPVFPSYIRTTATVLCSVIMGIGVLGNVMVPLVIFKSKDMRNSTNIFLMNLSLADLMVLLVCTPTVLVEVNSQPETWVLGEEMCKAVPFIEMAVAHASVLTILAISFERYYAICKPLKAGYVCTKARAFFICLCTWLVAAVLTSPILGMADYHHETYFDGSTVPVCWTLANSVWSIVFFVGSISTFFFLPLIILVILYTMIAINLMIHPGIVGAPHMRQENSSSAHRYRKQVILMLGTVVIFFFICLLPFRALTLWIIIVPHEEVQSLGIDGYYNLLYFCRLMFYLNSAINPILYNLMSSKFRNGFLKLCGIRKTCFHKQKTIFLRHGTFNTSSMTATSSINRSTSTTSRSKTRSSERSSCSKNLDKNCSVILNDFIITKDKYVPEYKRRNSSDELVLIENTKLNELNRKYSCDNLIFLQYKNKHFIDISDGNNISNDHVNVQNCNINKRNCKFIIENQSIKQLIDNNEQIKIIPNLFNVKNKKNDCLKESFV